MRFHEENDRLAKIVLAQGFCTPAQIEKCLAIQSDTTEDLSLGQSLRREGYLSDDQYSVVLTMMRSSPRKAPSPAIAGKRAPVSHQQQEDDLLGKLAVREGWITAAELSQCVREANRHLPPRPIGEVLVSRGYLDAAKAKDLLARLTRRIMSCPACKVSFSILSIAQSQDVDCPRCGGILREGKRVHRAAEDPFATNTALKAIAAALRPPPQKPQP